MSYSWEDIPKFGVIEEFPIVKGTGTELVRAWPITLRVGKYRRHFHYNPASHTLTHTVTGLRVADLDEYGRYSSDQVDTASIKEIAKMCQAVVDSLTEVHGETRMISQMRAQKDVYRVL